jgi:FkbM family methyltransferase
MCPKEISTNLIFDVGMCDGTDTCYYLSKGFEVIAIDADPLLCERAQSRFREEIASGRLTIINAGISDQEQTLTFYRNLHDPGHSTFSFEKKEANTPYESLPIECRTLGSVVHQFGVPFYIKVDLEGLDEAAIKSLTPDTSPRYISIELNDSVDPLETLRELGYDRFKLINQAFHTTSLEISDDDFVYRTMRKLGRIIPPIHRAIQLLPHSFRPRTEWDIPYRPDGWDPGGGLFSGPFGEDTHGDWRNYQSTRRTVLRMLARHNSLWWDLHAARKPSVRV